ncbi:MAG: autotransporter domain-containing protein [Elusimicrobiota bacterium]|nr:autotransporter domain-containing protein [Elusimicrobiota bacterium]
MRGANGQISFTNNTALNGGAIYVKNSNIEIKGMNAKTTFSNNIAQKGGAIYTEGIVNIELSNGSFEFILNKTNDSNGIIEFTSPDTTKFNIINAVNLIAKNNVSNIGGFLYFNRINPSITATNIAITGNSAINGSGGAMYYENTEAKIEGKGTISNNRTVNSGGAIYLKNGMLTITSKGNLTFEGNIDVNKTTFLTEGNDIFVDSFGNLVLNTQSPMYIKSGIKGAASSYIEKDGNAALYLSGVNKYDGNLSINAGSVIAQEPITINQITVQQNAILASGNADRLTISVGDLYVSGILKLKIDIEQNAYDKIMATNALPNAMASITLEPSSKLQVDVSGELNANRAFVLLEGGSITGEFGAVSVNFTEALRAYKIEYNPTDVTLYLLDPIITPVLYFGELSKNNEQVNKFFNAVSNETASADLINLTSAIFNNRGDRKFIEDTYNQLNGAFLANVLMSGADNQNIEIVFKRLRPTLLTNEESQTFWAQAVMNEKTLQEDEESIGSFKHSNAGAVFGTDIVTDRKYMLGIYGEFLTGEYNQNQNNGNFNSIAFGLYGMTPISQDNKFYLKGALSYSWQTNHTRRELNIAGKAYSPEANFNTNVLKLAIEIEKQFRLDNKWYVTPYLGLQGGFVFNNEIKESGELVSIQIKDGANSRIYTDFGISADYQAGKPAILHARIGAKTALTQDRGNINAAFLSDKTESMEFIGAKETIVMSFGIGMDYNITDAFAFNIGSNFDAGSATSGWGIGIGFNYRISNSQKAINESKSFDSYYEPVKPQAEVKPVAIAAQEETFEEEDLTAMLQEREERNKKAVEKITLGATTFVIGKAVLTNDSKANIKAQVEKLSAMNYTKIVVEGHTDSTGKPAVNDRLSKLRAESVYKEFIAAGIPAEKLEFIGYGDKIPAADNSTAQGRQANRRTEVWVLVEITVGEKANG